MKSFSFKAFALAFVVVTGSAQAMFTDEQAKAFTEAGNTITNNGIEAGSIFNEQEHKAVDAAITDAAIRAIPSFGDKVREKMNNICAVVSNPYVALTDSTFIKLQAKGYEKTANTFNKVAGFPVNHHVLSRTVLALGITAAAYKTYKYFTKPAVDATEEGVTVEANETTTKVA